MLQSGRRRYDSHTLRSNSPFFWFRRRRENERRVTHTRRKRRRALYRHAASPPPHAPPHAQLNLYNDTVLFFLSDNGATLGQAGGGSNWPLRGSKFTPFEVRR